MEHAKRYKTPAEFVRNIDRLLMYLARYGRADPVLLLDRPTVELLSWADRVHELLEEESRQVQESVRR